MPSTAVETTPTRGLRRLRARLDERGRDEGGFVLLETMIALTLITAIMAAVSVEYVNGIIVSTQQRSAATASEIASSTVSELRAYSPTDLVRGRSQADVLTQRNRLLGVERVKPWISASGTVTAYAAGSQRVVPTTANVVNVGGRDFGVDRYLECTKDATDGACVSAGNLTRLIVAVVWADRGCPATGCALVTATLLDTHADPTFDINQPLPAAPVVINPGDQVIAIGDKIGDKAGDTFPAVRFLVEDGTGAAPFTWQLDGTLPNGLSYSPDGGVSGIPSGPASDTPSSTTVTVTDAFQRKASATVRWTVKPKLALAQVPDQATEFKRPVSPPVDLSATGGAGGNVFSATGLPPGITLDQATGRISGSPTDVGTFSVVATVKDRTGKREASRSFTWTVTYPPLTVSRPATENSTKDQPDSVQIAVDGGSGEYSYAATNLPVGLSINTSTGLISGTPTTTSSRNVTVTVTDRRATTSSGARVTSSVSFAWNVLDRPTVTSPGNRTNSRTAAVDVALTRTCANGPCTYSISGQPGGVGIDSATGRISGTIASTAAVQNYAVRVTGTDAVGATATTTFTWTVVAEPSITPPANQAGTRGRPDSVSVTSTCGHGSCAFSATGLPSGLTVNSVTGAVSGTIASNATTSTTARITITDASGVSRTTNAFTWTVNAPPSWSSLGNRSSTRSTSTSVGFAGSVSGGTPSLTYSASNLPAGLSINAGSGVVSGTPTTAQIRNVTITVTDSHGAAATSNTFSWTVS